MMKCLNFASYIIRPQNQGCVTIYIIFIALMKNCTSKEPGLRYTAKKRLRHFNSPASSFSYYNNKSPGR